MRKRGDDSGVAILEFALISPVLLILFLAATDFTLYLQNYFALNHVLREGTRYLSGTDVLQSGTFTSPIGTVASRHQAVHNRMRLLISGAGLRVVGGTSTIQLTTSCLNNTPRVVRVRIDSQYQSLFVGNLIAPSMRLEAEAPYLFQNCL